MSLLANWIQTPMARALGWALAHFLWEGAVLATVLFAALRLMRGAPASRRYAAACLTLAAMPLAFAATLAVIWAMRPVAIAAPIRWASVPLADGPIAVPAARFSWSMIADRLPWLAPVWLAGVAFFYARGLASWAAVRRLRRRGVCAAPAEWQARLERLAARLRISRPVALLESCLTDAPVLIGWLRPAILLPIGCLTGLSTAQVECILLHELAHVARRDYAVNLLQSLVEGLLFYHPAVWWVSRVVRAERENCCDDRAVETMGDARAYAATLAVLEERRAPAPAGALAATGGNLMQRIRRLTTEPRGGHTAVAPAASAAALLAIFAAALTALPSQLPVRHARVRIAPVAMAAAAPQISAAKMLTTPYRKWLLEDVAYIITDRERTAFVALTTDAEREDFIEKFWERRDPTPDTQENEYREEHYRRIAYTNEHFSAGNVAGWKTDRGRTYIVYGPPDELDDHSTSKPATQQWRYRYIDEVGANVLVDFVDQHGTGDFQMTGDPSAGLSTPYRKWLDEDAAYVITDAERAAFGKLATDPERDKFITQFWQRRGQAFKTEHYRRIAYANENFATGIPGWKTDRGRIYITYGPPNTITSLNGRTIEWTYEHIDGMGNNITVQFTDRNGDGEYRMTKDPGEPQNVPPEEAAAHAATVRQIEALEKRLAEVNRQLEDMQAGLTTRQSAGQLTRVKAQLQLAKEEYQAAAKDGQETSLQQAQEKLGAVQEQLMSQEAAQSRVAELQSAAVQLEQQMAEKQRQEKALLSAQKGLSLEMEALAESAGPLEPGAPLGIRVEQTGPQSVTVHVPLDSPGDRYHALEQVRTPDGRIVHLSAADPTGSEFSHSIWLTAGKYRLVMVVKNLASGAAWRAYVDFEVN